MELNHIKMNIDTGLVLNIGYPMKNSNAPIAYNSLFASRNMNMLMLPLEVPRGGLSVFEIGRASCRERV